MVNNFQVLIIGGGNAGLGLAAQLLIKKSNIKIGIIEPSTKHYYQPAWTLVESGEFDLVSDITVSLPTSNIPSTLCW